MIRRFILLTILNKLRKFCINNFMRNDLNVLTSYDRSHICLPPKIHNRVRDGCVVLYYQFDVLQVKLPAINEKYRTRNVNFFEIQHFLKHFPLLLDYPWKKLLHEYAALVPGKRKFV